MNDFTGALEALLSEHRRIGSPVPGYLLPGLPTDDVKREITSTVGFDPPGELVELFAWHNGFDYDGWQRDVAPGFTRLFGDTYFASLAEAVDSRKESIQIDETTAEYSEPGEAQVNWKPSWFPAFCRGWEDFGVECQPGPAFGRVYLPSWQPPVQFGPGPRFRDLRHVVESVIRRFDAGGYTWDPEQRFLMANWAVLDPLEEVEIAEARA